MKDIKRHCPSDHFVTVFNFYLVILVGHKIKTKYLICAMFSSSGF